MRSAPARFRWPGARALRQALLLTGLTLSLSLGLVLTLAQPVMAGEAGSGGKNAPEHWDKPQVVLISLDAYRWDYPDLYPSPNIQRLIRNGARAAYLEPVWPTLTFPNHYSQVTGLNPAQHGLVGNDFPLLPGDGWFSLSDRSAVENGAAYGGTPIWVLAEQQNMVAASYFWVGSEAAIQGIRPTHWRRFDYKVPPATRVKQILSWLSEPKETRPHVITLYLGAVDNSSHRYGVHSEEMVESIYMVDEVLGKLMDGIEALPHGDRVQLALMSDHGQMDYVTDTPFILTDHVDLKDLKVVDKGTAVYLWNLGPAQAQDLADDINEHWSHGTAHTRQSAPEAWGLTGNPRFPDLVVQADRGYAVSSGTQGNRGLSPGDHGWVPEVPEMRGIFITAGPKTDAGSALQAMHSTDIFPMVVDWLQLDPPNND